VRKHHVKLAPIVGATDTWPRSALPGEFADAFALIKARTAWALKEQREWFVPDHRWFRDLEGSDPIHSDLVRCFRGDEAPIDAEFRIDIWADRGASTLEPGLEELGHAVEDQLRAAGREWLRVRDRNG
jgi:hypothetical protein